MAANYSRLCWQLCVYYSRLCWQLCFNYSRLCWQLFVNYSRLCWQLCANYIYILQQILFVLKVDWQLAATLFISLPPVAKGPWWMDYLSRLPFALWHVGQKTANACPQVCRKMRLSNGYELSFTTGPLHAGSFCILWGV